MHGELEWKLYFSHSAEALSSYQVPDWLPEAAARATTCAILHPQVPSWLTVPAAAGNVPAQRPTFPEARRDPV